MNIDEHREIVDQLGILQLPAVIAFDEGQPTDGFFRALPESQIGVFIQRLIGPRERVPPFFLEEAAEDGAAEAAVLYAKILAEDPANVKAIGRLAQHLVTAGESPRAKTLLETAPSPAPGKDLDPAIANAWDRVRFFDQLENNEADQLEPEARRGKRRLQEPLIGHSRAGSRSSRATRFFHHS
jgi:putative thioredoxin